ncbi:MAG: hypothetical protein AB8F78_07100 [Saprospiraceae bacterium]
MIASKLSIRGGLFVFQLLCLLLVACAQATPEKAVVVEMNFDVEGQEEKRSLDGSDLSIWSNVDTIGANAGVIEVLRTFFDDKLRRQSAEAQGYWIPETYGQFTRDYFELRVAEFGPDKSVDFWPTLLSIDAVEGHDDYRFANVRWASLDDMGSTDEVKYVFQFLVKPDANGDLRLSAPTEVLTEVWKRERVGEVTFVLSPKHKFSRKQANEQQVAIEEMTDFFEVDPFPITFYSFQYSTELLETRGYVVHPMFYKFETGGQAGFGDMVYSGNNRDEYVHEVAHLFIIRAVPISTGILNEGLATLIGGSSGYPYEWHLQKLKTWLAANPDVDLTQHLNPYQSQYIEEDTSIPYAIGAALCDKILKEHGKAVLFEALAEGKDPWVFLEGLGIDKGALRDVI